MIQYFSSTLGDTHRCFVAATAAARSRPIVSIRLNNTQIAGGGVATTDGREEYGIAGSDVGTFRSHSSVGSLRISMDLVSHEAIMKKWLPEYL